MKNIKDIEVIDPVTVKPRINWVLVWFLIGFIMLVLKVGALELDWFWIVLPFWIGAMVAIWMVIKDFLNRK